MASILKRTALCAQWNGIIRFLDWALVTTELGTAVEPFMVNQQIGHQTPIEDVDPEDECTRVDEIRIVDQATYAQLLSGGESTILHGGNYSCRIGP